MRATRSTALRATALVAVVYLLVSLILNVLVGAHATANLDVELHETLARLTRASANQPGGPSVIGYFGGSAKIDPDEELSKIPVAYWWVPAGAGSGAAMAADRALPALPRSLYSVGQSETATIGGSSFRVAGVQVTGGRWVVAISSTGAAHDVRVLELAEVVFLPVLLAGFFLVAYAIGRGASAPVEEARHRLLTFTADASHELRTPLSVIEAEVSLALSTERDAAYYRKTLGAVSVETGRLKNLVEELLWLARFDAGPRKSPSQPVDLSSVAEGCAKRFAALASERSVVLDVVREGGADAVVQAPPDWLDRLASVLVENACRYSASGSKVTITVSGEDGAPSLTVDDEGPGIPEEERERIFQRFHRAISVKGGSGLGLSIADAIVQATGGRWEVSSSPSGGARMRVSW